jgi:hypothetical protein
MSKLREAAQAIVQCFDTHGFVPEHRIKALRDALAEPEPEYELWGALAGGPGARWPVEQIEELVWPDGTALYVRVERKKLERGQE